MSFKIRLGNDKEFICEDGESILLSAQRNNIYLANSCTNGRCGACISKVLSGESSEIQSEIYSLDDGEILTCCRTAKTDMVLDIKETRKLPDQITSPCKINKLELLKKDIMRVELRLPPSSNFIFLPGQHVILKKTGIAERSYSIANGSFINNKLIFIIKNYQNGIFSDYLFNKAKINDLLIIDGPRGSFNLDVSKAKKKLLFFATGTGIAPINSMLEELFESGQNRHFESIKLFWGNRSLNDFYQNEFSIFNKIDLFLCTSREEASEQNFSGYVQEVAANINTNFNDYEIYGCGSDSMINSLKKILTDKRYNFDHFHYDAFVVS